MAIEGTSTTKGIKKKTIIRQQAIPAPQPSRAGSTVTLKRGHILLFVLWAQKRKKECGGGVCTVHLANAYKSLLITGYGAWAKKVVKGVFHRWFEDCFGDLEGEGDITGHRPKGESVACKEFHACFLPKLGRNMPIYESNFSVRNDWMEIIPCMAAIAIFFAMQFNTL